MPTDWLVEFVCTQRERLRVVLIKNKAWGTQVSRRLIADGCHGVTRYQPTSDKIVRAARASRC
jgi:hypothetical protein